MRLQTLSSNAGVAPICARCRVEMVLVLVRTIQFADGHEDMTYIGAKNAAPSRHA
jgi:hypothetical protein